MSAWKCTALFSPRQHLTPDAFDIFTYCGLPVTQASSADLRTLIGMDCGRCRRAAARNAKKLSIGPYGRVLRWVVIYPWAYARNWFTERKEKKR